MPYDPIVGIARFKGGHRWSGWPGAICLYCGCEDPEELRLAGHKAGDFECPASVLEKWRIDYKMNPEQVPEPPHDIAWDQDNYPLESSLKKLENEITSGNYHRALWAFYLALCEHANPYGICGLTKKEVRGERIKCWEYHTHGWSGNESIIACLERSYLWSLIFERYDSGGHYYFNLDHAPKELQEEMLKRIRERYR